MIKWIVRKKKVVEEEEEEGEEEEEEEVGFGDDEEGEEFDWLFLVCCFGEVYYEFFLMVRFFER